MSDRKNPGGWLTLWETAICSKFQLNKTSHPEILGQLPAILKMKAIAELLRGEA
jgi:hypothetical protein